jgi:hypothetical protein
MKKRIFDPEQWERDLLHLDKSPHRAAAEAVLQRAQKTFSSIAYQTEHSRLVESDRKTILYSPALGRWWLVINCRMPYLRLEFPDPRDRITGRSIERGVQWRSKSQKWFTLQLDESPVAESLLSLVERIFDAQS